MSKGFRGMPGGGNMQGLMQQAKKMQEQIQRATEEAERFQAEGQSGGGMVKVIATGANRLLKITIDPDVVDKEDVDMLQDLVMAAVNAALEKIEANKKQNLEKVTGGMPLPGLL